MRFNWLLAHSIFLLALPILLAAPSAFAQKRKPAVEVEWYPPELDISNIPNRAKVIITGRTQPNSTITIEGGNINVLKESNSAPVAPDQIEDRETKANIDGFFEISMDLPPGINQIPIQIVTPARAQKVFMISVDVSIQKNNVRTNQEVSKKKPPAASKKYRFWSGAGFTYQTYRQSMTGVPDLSFKAIQAPGYMARGGYWGDNWGLDFYFRDAPGKMEADAPFVIESGRYRWRTIEAKGLYQFNRGPSTRLLRLPAQWQLRFGAQMHTVPFIDVDNSQVISIKENGLTTATLGGGLLLGQEKTVSYEFAFGLQFPLAASGYKVSSPLGYEAQLGAAYKFAPNWRIGIFSYSQSISLKYEYNRDGLVKNGSQTLFHSTFDLRLGYEF